MTRDETIAAELVACTLGQRARPELRVAPRRGMADLAVGPRILRAATRLRIAHR